MAIWLSASDLGASVVEFRDWPPPDSLGRRDRTGALVGFRRRLRRRSRAPRQAIGPLLVI